MIVQQSTAGIPRREAALVHRGDEDPPPREQLARLWSGRLLRLLRVEDDAGHADRRDPDGSDEGLLSRILCEVEHGSHRLGRVSGRGMGDLLPRPCALDVP
ncbi:hypothetical protein GCM10014719_27520 [Planomonospora parontospora subsp. antibiotica]|nr:hypothetical protein GCM10014719_27520 [Planomonospora parontospora subsp. antibiotica]GII15114.1 hypothetical protein Ppa05_18400 [Planomonospora parontospora subsp. antibiotica]